MRHLKGYKDYVLQDLFSFLKMKICSISVYSIHFTSAKIKTKYLFLWMPVRKIEILIDFHTPIFREKYTFNLVTSLPEFWSELRWWLRFENVVHFQIQIHWDYITEITLNNTDFFSPSLDWNLVCLEFWISYNYI